MNCKTLFSTKKLTLHIPFINFLTYFHLSLGYGIMFPAVLQEGKQKVLTLIDAAV